MTLRIASLLTVLLISTAAVAERADRNKPLQLEANRVSIDDAKKIQILEGDVILIKGTMILKADKVIITEDQYGFQKGTATGGKGGLARIRQKREGREEYMEGEAERIEYNTNNEVAELFNRAWVKSGQDEVKGDYIWYDGISEKYLVTAGAPAKDGKTPPARVRAIIQPKNKDASLPQPASATPLELRGESGLSTQPGRQ